MKYIIYILLFLLGTNAYAQRETDNWYFGDKAGVNFLNPNPSILNDGEMDTPAGCSSISDNQGNLLFYTNGQTIWNKNHEIMEDGSDLIGEIENNQTTIIIPKPESNEVFYVFFTKTATSTNPVYAPGVYFVEVEISNQFPLGKVTTNPIRIRESSTQQITAVHHADGKSIWLITFGALNGIPDAPFNTFNLFKIDNSGFASKIVSIREEITSNNGAMKASSDGKLIAVSDLSETNIDLYNFNNETGEITLNRKIFTDTALFAPKHAYGVEFSADSKRLYYTAEIGNSGISTLNQLLLENPNPGNPIFQEKRELIASNEVFFGSLQLASNSKIYVALQGNTGNSNNIGVVNFPEKIGLEIDFNYLNLQSKASEKGLPNFIQSYFRNRIISENKCISETFNFSTDSYAPITSISWDFGDGNTSIEREPNHTYNLPGNYLITAQITYNNTTVNIYKEIEVFPLPNLIPDQALIQCDTNNDGVDFFDLYDIREKITDPTLNEEMFFYRNLLDAQNDEDRIDNAESFENESNPQELFVRVVSDKECYSITNFFIESKFVQLGNIMSTYSCDSSDNVYEDGKALFDLRRKADEIRQQFSLPSSNRIRFYPNEIDAQTTNNEINTAFVSSSITIYARIDTDLGCGGIEPFNVIVNDTPSLNILETYTICYIPNLHNPIIIDGNTLNNRFEWRNENGTIISTNREYTLNQTGNFSLTTYKTENGMECSNYREFSVVNPSPPEITTINVDTETDNFTVEVFISGNSSYNYSLDNINFEGNGLTHTFNFVEPGLKTVYIRDINNCEEPIQKEVSVIGFPKFLTPNNDGNNDTWSIKGASNEFFKSINLHIFNRFGKVIYTINLDNYQNGWDGTFNGKKVPPNSYWYKAVLVDINDKTIEKQGSISLIR